MLERSTYFDEKKCWDLFIVAVFILFLIKIFS